MNVAKSIVSVLHLMVTLPIWYYLMYQMLVRLNATDVMWLLFWIYLPVNFVAGIIQRLVELEDK